VRHRGFRERTGAQTKPGVMFNKLDWLSALPMQNRQFTGSANVPVKKESGSATVVDFKTLCRPSVVQAAWRRWRPCAVPHPWSGGWLRRPAWSPFEPSLLPRHRFCHIARPANGARHWCDGRRRRIIIIARPCGGYSAVGRLCIYWNNKRRWKALTGT
jgi:hypothetical protein